MGLLLHASFDMISAQAFDTYLKQNMPGLLSVKDILNDKPEVTAENINKLVITVKGMHVNLLNTMTQRVFKHIEKLEKKNDLTKEQRTNLCSFLANDYFDKDLFIVNAKALGEIDKTILVFPFIKNGTPTTLSSLILKEKK